MSTNGSVCLPYSRPFHSGDASPVRSEHAVSEVSFTMYSSIRCPETQRIGVRSAAFRSDDGKVVVTPGGDKGAVLALDEEGETDG